MTILFVVLEWTDNDAPLDPFAFNTKRRLGLALRTEEQSDLTDYEFCALEGLVTIIKSYEEQELAAISASLGVVLRYYRNGQTPPVAVEKQFKEVKGHLFGLKKRVLGYKATLVAATEDEEQMALMNLSFLKTRPDLYR